MGVCFLFSARGKFNVPVLGCGAVGLQDIHNRYLCLLVYEMYGKVCFMCDQQESILFNTVCYFI